MSDPIIILGIDPGLRMTGFGVVEKSGDKIRYLGSGVIKTVSAKVDARDSLPERIQIILEGLFEVIDQYKPKQVAIEKVFVNVNPQSTLLLGQARGAAISAAVIKKLPVYEYTALQVKKSVVGCSSISTNSKSGIIASSSPASIILPWISNLSL